ncbi:MAG: hypothetical protein JW955_17970 [Sedimentisphaerales bacterium]|nr:hypothetical protein [Sedimentisphaerales bacterium]
MNDRHVTDQQQFLAELARTGSENRQESAVVISPGASTAGRVVTIKSHVQYNVYSVRAVVVGAPGSIPVEVGESMEAVNLAESFLDQGTVPSGRYAAMSRVGETNVLYAVP